MKRIFTLLGIVAMGATVYGQAGTDFVNIPDENFKIALIENTSINTDGDTEISYEEAREYTGNINVRDRNISSLEGIEAFVNITGIDCSWNALQRLDVSKNTALEFLDCGYNRLTSLDLSKNIALKKLHCHNNILRNLDVSKNVALQTLWCTNNSLTTLDVSKNMALTDLSCSNNRLTSLDVSKNTALQTLECYKNQLTSLNLSKNIALEELICSSNKLRVLVVIKNTELKKLYCSDNQITSLDVSKNMALQELECSKNQIKSLDVSKNIALINLDCSSNELTQLNLANGNNVILKYMNAVRNRIDLTCIQIDSSFNPPYEWKKDNHASYSNNCGYTLSTTEVAAEQAIQILNPVKDNLVIKTTAKIERVEIYNTAGQLVRVLFKGNTQVQDLAKGVYLIKITTDKGVITQKIIKQ